MDMRIENSENLEVAFHCIVRLYKRDYDVKLLGLLHRICDEYLVWFHLRVVLCAVRDLLHDRGQGEQSVPETQKISFEWLIRRLVRQGITLECNRCDSYYTEEEALRELGRQMGFTPGVYEEVRFHTFEAFRRWVRENHLDEPAAYRADYNGKSLPVKKRFIKDFGRTCMLMVRYSFEGETYLRYSCYSFVYHNIRLLDENVILGIRDYLESAEDDENYWMNLKNVLDKELARRKLWELYAGIYENEETLNFMLASFISADALVSYERCREAWWRISAFEEFVKGKETNERKLRYQSFLRRAKEVIHSELSKYEDMIE